MKATNSAPGIPARLAERRERPQVTVAVRPQAQAQAPSQAQAPARPARRVDPASNLTLGIFLLITLGGLAGGGGKLFPPAYVGAAILAGLIAYHREPERYLWFTYGLWAFSPFVRRVADLHSGYDPTNVVLLAPVLVTLISILTLLYRARELRGTMLFPFIFTLSGVGYAYSVGVLKNGFAPATYAMLTWVAPISFAVHLNLSWRIFPRLRDAFMRYLHWAVPVIAGYGIYQLVKPPPWDTNWMTAANVLSLGAPVPFGFRVFSTLNTPGPLAATLVVGMLFLFSSARRGVVLALTLALITLMLTRVRSSWAAVLVGFMVVQFMGPIRRTMRNWFLMAFMGVLAVPLLSLDAFRESISSRLSSFASISQDASFESRKQLSYMATQAIFANADGEGLGAAGGGVKLGKTERQASIDNGLLEVFYILGWPGGALLFLGLAGHLITLLRFRDAREDAFANSARACFWALMSVLLIGDIFSGSTGILFWGSYGFACSAHAYNFATGKGLRSRELAREFVARQPAAGVA